jgi:hypothetical protein
MHSVVKLGSLHAFWLASAAAVVLARRIHPRSAITAGGGVPVGSVLLTVIGRHWTWSLAVLVGVLVAGTGLGAAFSGARRKLASPAQVLERPGPMSGSLAASRIAISPICSIAGLLAHRFGLAAHHDRIWPHGRPHRHDRPRKGRPATCLTRLPARTKSALPLTPEMREIT